MLLVAPMSRAQSAPLQDNPLHDRDVHVLLGASCALLASAVAATALSRDSANPDYPFRVSAAGLGAAVAVGALKETLDLAGFGDPDLLDLLATVVGGLGVSPGVYAVCRADPRKAPRLAPAFVTVGVVLALPVGEALFKRLFSR